MLYIELSSGAFVNVDLRVYLFVYFTDCVCEVVGMGRGRRGFVVREEGEGGAGAAPRSASERLARAA